jgi:hypothetical protein
LLIKDNLILRNLLTDQIKHLNIDIKETRESYSKIGSEIFAIILSLCKNLVVLSFCHVFSARNYSPPLSYLERGRCISSTLLDCLYLFDEPFACLSTLIINMSSIYSIYIDGIQLHDQLLIYMTQLKKFTFNIKTVVFSITARVKLQSIEDIQRSFIGRGYQPVASYAGLPSFSYDGECYIYSLPYDFEYFRLDNSFQGGVFDKVRRLTMADQIPFENKLSKLISEDFPFLEMLYICNIFPQEHNHHSSISITFPCLKFLDVMFADVDYAERFLLKNNMYLPRLSSLSIKYEVLILYSNK